MPSSFLEVVSMDAPCLLMLPV